MRPLSGTNSTEISCYRVRQFHYILTAIVID
jgi:hypothetical protein